MLVVPAVVAGFAAYLDSYLGVRMRILALLFLLPSLCFADDWSKEDTYRQAALTALLVADWAQTRYIAKNPDKFHEIDASRFIGEHPSTGKVNVYFATYIVSNATVSYLLPQNWRQAWQYLYIGYETKTVLKNRSIGIKMDF